MDGCVSVIMPAYNSGDYIAKSIDSVLAQTYENFELIVINDCSTDNTLNIIRTYDDHRIIAINMTHNSGVAEARNEGIRRASGQFIAFLDSDDMWKPTKLQTQIDTLLRSNCHCCHTAYNRITEDGNIISTVNCKKLVSLKDMLKHNEIGNLTGLYDVYALGKIYQETIGHEDYLMWLNIMSNTDSVGIQLPLAEYRVRKSSLSSNKFKSLRWHYEILKKIIGFKPVKLSYLMMSYVFLTINKRY
ncbi:glycosyltransferase family 2 protein [Enterobacter sp. ECC-175]|uniref:glycosyltransferase family 2 protein n=1 Tax=unclassified Enterobacter TaxID=2608935 RepID=UPI000D4EEBA0|nr:glycosyltransferase family 2 protein [Enterobacter sp. RIT 418]RAU36896.1 glycosyltransferase family 2 protein [Enterobacter sp. RIT 418]